MSLASATVGALFIGMFFAAILSGFTSFQALTFLQANKRDPPGHKISVLVLWFLDTLQLAVIGHLVYFYTISEPITLESKLVWSYSTHILLQKIILPLTQGFYVLRIWRLRPRNQQWIPALLAMLVLFNFAMGIYLSVRLFKLPTLLDLVELPFKGILIVLLSTASAGDILIAACLVYTLAKAGTNMRWTDSSWVMLLAYLLNTGVIVSMFSLAGVISFLASEHTFTFLGIEAVVTKLYVNSFIGMLNARLYLQSSSKPGTTLFLQSDAHYNLSKINGDSRSAVPTKTINEIGLPLFPDDTVKARDLESIKIMEVMVQQESNKTRI